MAPSGPADVTPAQMDDILRQSPFCGCSQVIASFGSAIEVATAGQKYQVSEGVLLFSAPLQLLGLMLTCTWYVLYRSDLGRCSPGTGSI